MDALVRLAACEWLMLSSGDRLSGLDAGAARRVMAAVGPLWDAALRELELQPAPSEVPPSTPVPLSVLDLAQMGAWLDASEAAKDALGLPDTVRVFVVPESAVVSIDGVVVS